MDEHFHEGQAKGASSWVAAVRARCRGKMHWIATGFSIFLLALSIVVLGRILASVKWWELRVAIAQTGWDQIALAALFTGVSYLALTGYDALALRQLRLRVKYRRTALASFTSYAISFTLGFPPITAGTVRYWIYSQSGLTGAKVASLTIIAGVTFWLGMALVIGVALIVDPVGVAEINHLKAPVNLLIGALVLSAIGGWLAWVSRRRRRIRIKGIALELPGFWLTIGQIALGVVDLCAASAALYALLPRGLSPHYFDFAAAYVFSCLLGIASNAPGGLGAFEMTMLNAVRAPSVEGMLASLLMFRAVYYAIPFVLALAMLGAHESVRRWSMLRADMNQDDDDNSG